LIRKQIENSVSTFSFPILIYIMFISFFLMCLNNKSFGADSQLELDESNEISFFLYTDPGIYKITCNVNGKVYIGEAKNLLDRINKHFKDLENGLSDCYELQRDWQVYGKDCFTMRILFKGEAFLTREKRLEKETQIINLYKPEQVYNQHPQREIILEDNYRVICEINGQRFESIKQASKHLNVSENNIRRRLFNKQPGYLIIEKVRQGYEPIIANGKYYDSIIASVRAGEAKDRFQAMRYLKSQSKPNWNYVNVEKRIDKN